ncbi:23S rRNA (uracil(1939)-C(5))-methyltransferase RlmD [Rufibacter latericius]|uniref:23S rRNA (Uracil(1939)-C(5))-methyltransferase RlmD n=1 Tax=Rufibacter latericius TaxID=2487040 RepID=A0A3M9MKA2_9BACT|nr:23S rRNA (uracil(1939)-C(5))-methyltransferase RlmD [Rufibacter latericius]RNI25625.1 23S rRNA (uracil(1939)-C(5))-methyltransferase RlmD [Rufibacter latericius]
MRKFKKKKHKYEVIPQLRVEEMAAEGKCISRHDNLVVFISDVAPGDVVDVRVTKKRKNYLEAVPVHFHEYSEARTQPFCEHFNVCGGCKWQHIPYDTQLFYKQKQVNDNIERIGKITGHEMLPILPSDRVSFYRNKLEFTFSGNAWLTKEQIDSGEDLDRRALGFHVPLRFDKIVDIQHCYLQPAPSNEIRLAVKNYARENNLPFFDLVKQEGFLRNLIIRTANTGDLMVIVQVFQDRPEWLIPLLDFLRQEFPQISSLHYVINSKGNETFHDLEVVCYHGDPYIHEQMEGLRFRVGPKSFYQTNSEQTYNLYKLTREFAVLNGHETVYDLYTGAGTIANFVARSAAQVVGIEYVASAIEDAKINSQINDITNTHFYAGDMKDVLTHDLFAKHGRPDVIITDPPRAGMHPDVVAKLLEVKASRIVYVSCNPATQARDLEMLADLYDVVKIQPVDMFPQTYHVESVALLTLRS